MNERTVGAARFKADCLRLIEEIGNSDEAVIVTERGRPVPRLTAIKPEAETFKLFGGMEETVLRYDDPFEPATSPDGLDAER